MPGPRGISTGLLLVSDQSFDLETCIFVTGWCSKNGVIILKHADFLALN